MIDSLTDAEKLACLRRAVQQFLAASFEFAYLESPANKYALAGALNALKYEVLTGIGECHV